MKVRIIFLFALMGVVFSCKKEETVNKDSTGLNNTVDSLNTLPTPPNNSSKVIDTVIENIILNGVSTKCSSLVVERIQRVKEFNSFYDLDKSDIWPGNIVQGEYIQSQGKVVGIGAFPREPINISITGSQGTKGITVVDPNKSNILTSISNNSRFLWFMPPVYTYQQCEIKYSKEQTFADFGLSYQFLAGNVKLKFDDITTVGSNSMYMLIKTIYFQASAEYPSNPAGFFKTGTVASDLKRVMSKTNPPAYISSVSYGRMAVVKLESTYNQREVVTALNVYFGKIGGDLSIGQKKIISDLKLTLESSPGPSTTINSIEELNAFLNNTSEYNHRTGFAPVSFEVRHLTDNSPLMSHTGFVYKINQCL
jgi:thiol-activated cytolysin